MEIGTTASIVVICYLAGVGLKVWPKFNSNMIPFCSGFLGGLLGLLEYAIVPGYAADPLGAIALGISSGLAAVGVNQIYKKAKEELGE